VSDLKAQIAQVQRGEAAEASPHRKEALRWREYLSGVRNQEEREIALDYLIERTEAIDFRAGKQGDGPVTEEARAFFDLATGKATPISAYVERWLETTTYTARTKADARTAVEQLCAWLKETGRTDFIETIDDRAAADFRDDGLLKRGVHRKTANKKLSALRQYWKWLGKSFGGAPNPWLEKSLPKPQAHKVSQDGAEGRERPFTDDELHKLLAGDADDDLADMMHIAALSGMRLDEIGQLRIEDCRDEMFTIRGGKTSAAVRQIPIHSKLRPIIKARSNGKDGRAYLFPALRSTGWDGNRTMAISKRFTYYRRRLGVDDRREGARRSKVNFHSFRRWFISKADEAGHPRDLIAAIVGHERGSITLDVYSRADLGRRMRRCVESVKLPVILSK
jgi:integrase